ncbi:putative enzyme related to lactoylglutathione lyase [Actinomadura hallensis]|uniref:Putative enzyme related to lactoylglutathione lyase n=1 Tax=Actinomadura hallensis TaxID=337895 RepID=A0A543IGH0_9ACTN|nr:VOC family protein [Actinomadura hallensis]TQM69678.1 putative enzyme related to lactoylglutathione lyase [Actinomadura hallensis]
MKIGHVIVPAADLDAQLAFYESLGLTRKFRDGDRYAALTDGETTIGLADESQQPVTGRTVISVEVDDLDAVAGHLSAGEPVTGPHERRVVVTDPCGNPVVLYERLP